MCGIVGLIGWNQSKEKGQTTIIKMANAINHRGPDDEGIWVDSKNQLFFGHKRLSILDLSKAGKQPMISANDRFVIIFNGEIYNHLELRKSILKKYDINWRGYSDTETLIELISLFGIEKALDQTRGMFALALFDKKKGEILLARDRLGEKPLYVLNLENKFISFSSEIVSFNYLDYFTPEINLQAAYGYFKRGWIPSSECIWKNIIKIKPGHLLKIKRNNIGKYQIYYNSPYWNCKKIATQQNLNKFNGTFEQSTRQLENILYEVIESQKISDVPLGVFLSGGIDSSLVSALMQYSSEKKIKTFSIGFSEKDYDESIHAENIARHLKTEHLTLRASPEDAMNLVLEMPKVYSEPFADSSQIPTTLLCQLARKHVTVALSGDGGDELFGGYTRYIMGKKIFKILSHQPYLFRLVASKILRNFPPNFFDKIGQLININRLGDKLSKTSRILTLNNYHDYYDELNTYWPDNTIISKSKSNIYDFSADFDDIGNMMLADQLNYLPDDILVKVDRASMSVGLETRAPFLDHKVFEFAWSIPNDWRIDKNGGKKILREILYKHVPKKFVDRPKQGFGMPVNEWLKKPLRHWVEELLSIKNLPKDGLLNRKVVHEIWNEHLTGKKNWEYRLWPVLMWQQWLLSIKN